MPINPIRPAFAEPDTLRERLKTALPVRDLTVLRVGLGVLIIVVGLGVWLLGHGSDPEGKAPEESLSRATTTSGVPQTQPHLPPEVVVQVAGAVRTPGVVRLVEGSRVADAVDSAGGLDADADTDRLNLAAKVSDGERLYVIRRGEQAPPLVIGSQSGTTGNGAPDSEAGPININTAGEKTLEELPGVGPATAKAIVDYRSKSGPFASVQDLAKVKGIGPSKLEQITPMARV